MMTLCEQVHVYEYIPSVRQSDLCHYHERYYDAACTLGAYHPLLYEKSLIQRINTGPESDLRKKGRVTLPGFSAVNCDIWTHSPSLSWNTLAFPRWPRGAINWRRGSGGGVGGKAGARLQIRPHQEDEPRSSREGSALRLLDPPGFIKMV